jgi:saccharopine dehydrogenase-like NADP-dependent oxidoreductase
MTRNYERTILLTDPTGTVSNAVIKQLASSDQNIIRAAVDTKNKVDKIKYAHEIVNIDYARPETIADALNNVDMLFLRIPPSVEMVDISSSFIEEAKKNGVNSEIIDYGS